jgi:hypothetical protein
MLKKRLACSIFGEMIYWLSNNVSLKKSEPQISTEKYVYLQKPPQSTKNQYLK